MRDRTLGVGLLIVLAVAGGAAAAGDGSRLVIDAAKNGDGRSVRTLLQRGLDVNAKQVDGTTALHWAVRADNQNMVRQLLAAGANANAANRYGVTPLSLAATNGSAAIVEQLLKSGANANATLLEGETVLMTAARTGTLAVLKLLLDHGADPNAKEHGFGETALMWAAAQNHAAAVKLLISRGADMNVQSIALKLTKPRTPITVLPRGSWTALMFAARQNAFEAALALADGRADFDIKDPDGTTALVFAIINAHYRLATMLLDKGADPNAADSRGMNALYAAIDMHTLPWIFGAPPPKNNDERESLGMVRALLDHGANPNAALAQPALQRLHTPGDPFLGEGATPFMRAAKSGDLVVMRLLLEKGADPRRVQKNGTTALIVASGLGWQDGGDNLNTRDRGTQADAVEAIKLCLELGLDVRAANNSGATVLHAAVMRGESAQIIRFLVDQGARVDAKNQQGQTPLDLALARTGQDGAMAVVPATVDALRQLLAESGVKTTAHSR